MELLCPRGATLLNSRLSAYGQSNIKNLAIRAIANAWPSTGKRPGYI